MSKFKFSLFTLISIASLQAYAARFSCEALFDAAKHHLRHDPEYSLEVLKSAAFVEVELPQGRKGLLVHAAGRGPTVFVATASGGEPLDPESLEDGDYAYIGPLPLLSVAKGRWVWTDGVGADRQHPGLRAFLNAHKSRVIDLMREEGYSAQDIGNSEAHPFELEGKPSWVLRLPRRLGQTEDRFRDLWIFRGRARAIPISVKLEKFKPNAKIFRAGEHLLYRELREGRSFYGFVDGQRLAEAERIEDLELRGLWRTQRKRIERLFIQPRPLAIDEFLKAKAIEAYADEPERKKYVVIVREGQEPEGYVHDVVGILDHDRKWPHLAEDFRTPRTLLVPDGRRVKTWWHDGGLNAHIYDPNVEGYRLEGVRVFAVGEDWFLDRLGYVRRWSSK